MYYIVITAAAGLFASQFLFNQKFNDECGDTLSSAMLFSALSAVISFFVMLLIGGGMPELSWVSFGLAAAAAVLGIFYTVASMKAFSIVNLSVYSVFAMLGGMLLPFLYDIIFMGAELTINKVISCILISLALVFTVSKGEEKTNGRIYYALVFLLNGLNGVLSTIHQSLEGTVGSTDFMALNRAVSFVASVAVLMICKQKIPKINGKAVLFSGGYAVFCGIGNLCVLIALKHINASVQYPIITGGTMVFSLLISAVRRERITYKNILSTLTALAASIIIVIP